MADRQHTATATFI